MTALEFSNQFDVLYNNITSNQAPGLNEYEKSVFLTKAQDEILKSYFDPRLNKSNAGFDGSEKRQIDFSRLIETKALTLEDSNTSGNNTVVLPSEAMMIINEYIEVKRNEKVVALTVLPISNTEWARLTSKPYKRPNHYQAWRVMYMGLVSMIIVGANDVFNGKECYTIRYVKRPYPIILEDLKTDGLSIHGNQETLAGDHACELDPILHEEILQRAVELAKASYTGDLNSQLALGVNSETNMGMVSSR